MNPPTSEIAELFGKRAFEIAYASLRIADQCGNQQFSSYMDSYGMMLLDSVMRGDIAGSKRALDCIRQFMNLGAGSGFVSQQDADLLSNAANNLNAAMPQSRQAKLPDSHIDKILSSDGKIYAQGTAKEDRVQRSSASTGERQKQILERIRQSGNCRIKDIQEYFPGVSERTLRYDLQELLLVGSIERLGNGGPSVSYRIRPTEIVPASTPVIV